MTTPTFSTGQPSAARRLPFVSLNAWSIYAVAIALLVSVPILVVFSAVFAPTGEVWRHLVDTVLWNYIRNTLWIILGVGLATLVTGVLTAWLVTTCRFPGRRIFEWALLLPLAVPSYAIAFTYAGMFEFTGPVQTALRGWFGWSRAEAQATLES